MVVCMVLEFFGIIVIALFQGRIMYALTKESNKYGKVYQTNIQIEQWLFDKEKARLNFRDEGYFHFGAKDFTVTTTSIQYYFRFHSGNDIADSL